MVSISRHKTLLTVKRAKNFQSMPATHLYISSPEHDRIHLLQGQLSSFRYLIFHKSKTLGQKDVLVESYQLYLVSNLVPN